MDEQTKCAAFWIADNKVAKDGRACRAPARYRVSFVGMSMLVCRYHRDLAQKELRRKGVGCQVTELFPRKHAEAGHAR